MTPKKVLRPGWRTPKLMGGIWGSKKEQLPAYLEVEQPGDASQAWEEALVQQLLADFHKRHRIDLKRDEMAMKRLQDAAARARQELATAPTTQLKLPFLAADASGPKTLDLELRRKPKE